jgi:hypothetical protein
MPKAVYFTVLATVLGGVLTWYVTQKLSDANAVASGTQSAGATQPTRKQKISIAFKNSGGGYMPGYINTPIRQKDVYSTGPRSIKPLPPV